MIMFFKYLKYFCTNLDQCVPVHLIPSSILCALVHAILMTICPCLISFLPNQNQVYGETDYIIYWNWIVHNQRLVYAVYINLLGKHIHTVKQNTRALLVSIQKLDLEVNTEKSKCMFMSYEQNAKQSNSLKIANIFFENVLKFKYFGSVYVICHSWSTRCSYFSLCIGDGRDRIP